LIKHYWHQFWLE